MRWSVALAALVACHTAAPHPVSERPPVDAAPPPSAADRAAGAIGTDELMASIAWLTAPDLHGRGSLSDDAKHAADRIAAELTADGLEVTRQPVEDTLGQVNVIGVLRGTDDAIVVCAHYDHLGVKDGQTYWGADDDASGTAVVLALARTFAKGWRGPTVVFLFTGAEEEGLLGSRSYVDAPVVPLARTRAMLNFDMVGRNFFELAAGLKDTFAVVGLEADARLAALIHGAVAVEDVREIDVTAEMLSEFGFGDVTDDYWFRENHVPTAYFSTSKHADYHEPTDTADKLVPSQMLHVARVAARTLVALGLRPTP